MMPYYEQNAISELVAGGEQVPAAVWFLDHPEAHAARLSLLPEVV